MNISKYLYPIVTFLLTLGSVIDGHAMIEGEWKYISSFNPNTTIAGNPYPNHVRRIIYGNNYAYFLVHGRAYLHPSIGGQTWGTHGKGAAVLYRTDNRVTLTQDSAPEIEAIADIPGIGGTVVNNIEYDPTTGCLAIAYKDGTITLLYDDGEIKNVNSFKEMPLPVMKEIRNITFDTDHNRIYFAGTFGFLVIDASRGEMTDLCMTTQPLEYAFRSGNSMIAIGMCSLRNDGSRDNSVTGDIYEAPYEQGLKDWEAFKVLEVDETVSRFANTSDAAQIATAKAELFADGKVSGTVWGAPFNEDTFGIFCSPTQNRKVSVLKKLGNGKWGYMYVMDLSLPYEKNYAFQMSPFEGYYSVTENGFGMQSGKNYWMVDRSKSPDLTLSDPIAAYTENAWVHKRLDSGETGKYYDSRHISTLDGNTAWIYEPFAGFKKCADSAGNGAWSDLSGIGLPNSPVVGVTDNMSWDAANGLILRQFGYSYSSHYNSANLNERDNMAIRKNGIWRDYSIQKVSPDVVSGLADPNEVVVDPMHPEYVYCGSRLYGIMRRNLNDPSDVVFFGAPGEKSPNEKLPGFVSAFPEQPLWKGVCMVYSLSFDDEGNLWVAYSHYSNQKLVIYKWNRADIDASFNLYRDPSSYIPMTNWEVNIPDVNNKVDFFKLNHAANRNLAVVGTGKLEILYVVEFGEAGPVLHKIDEAYTKDGDMLRIVGCYDLYEHPETGEVWCGTASGIMCFKPSEILSGTGSYRLLDTEVKGASQYTSNPLHGGTCFYLKPDDKGRVWISNKGNGLFCLSPDGKEILAHFNKENSPLPDDNVMGICWDGDTHSLIVATYDGLYEFTPYESMPSDQVKSVRVWPETLYPDYNGWISISGVPDSMELALEGENSSKKLSLPQPQGGMIQWDGRDGQKRMAAGRYNIVEEKTGRSVGEIVVY